MGTVIRLTDAARRRRPATFDRRELQSLLSLYSRRVISGEWRDYAIHLGDGLAVFAVFRHTNERPVLTITKFDPPSCRGRYVIRRSGRATSWTDQLEAALRRLEPALRLVQPE